jgi:hypothetical protein
MLQILIAYIIINITYSISVNNLVIAPLLLILYVVINSSVIS